MNINNIGQATAPAIEVINSVHQKARVRDVLRCNKNRHRFILMDNDMTYWLMYKRQLFLSFGKIFGFTGAGESINKYWIERALEQDITAFIFVYGSGNVYIVPPLELKKFAEKNGTIRKTRETGEITYSVPVNFLRRWKKR